MEFERWRKEGRERRGRVVVISKKMSVEFCRHGNTFNMQTKTPSFRPILSPEVFRNWEDKASFAP